MKTRSGGLAMVEFAITVPLVLFVFIAVAELGRAFYQYTALTKAVRDGARLLATYGSGSSGGIGTIDPDEINTVKRLVVTGTVAANAPAILPGLTVDNVIVDYGSGAGVAADDDYVLVRATYSFQPLFAAIPTFAFGTGDIAVPVQFSSTAIQRSLRS